MDKYRDALNRGKRISIAQEDWPTERPKFVQLAEEYNTLGDTIRRSLVLQEIRAWDKVYGDPSED